MAFFITLVSSHAPLEEAQINAVKVFLTKEGFLPLAPFSWLCPHKAGEFMYENVPLLSHIKSLRALLKESAVDLFVTPAESRRKKLLLADMDSTIVIGETLDEIAAHAGIRDKIAPITERAMRGELDFAQALRERVSLLRGLPESVLYETRARMTLYPGARVLTDTMRKEGAFCVLVSGGFTQFTSHFAQEAGFDAHHGNTLLIENGALTGRVEESILDKNAKLRFLQHYREQRGLRAEDVLAIGDGANDLPMLQAAGLGVGYHPKPLLEETLENCILHGDLSAVLYVQGYKNDQASF